MTSQADVESAIARAEQWGPLRVVVSCAGVGWAARTLNKENQPHALDLVHDGHHDQPDRDVQRCGCPRPRRWPSWPRPDGDRGVIINTASVAAFDGQIGQIAYTASKAGVHGMTLPLAARDLSAVGVRVNTIAPGTFDTPMLGGAARGQARIALAAGILYPKRLGNPAEYADLVAFIVGNQYLNAETIRLDGALRMPPK